MLMDIPAPGLDIGLQIGDTVDDGHGEFSVTGLVCFVFSSLARVRDPPNSLRRCTAGHGEAMALGPGTCGDPP
jgi:hypothetical protein